LISKNPLLLFQLAVPSWALGAEASAFWTIFYGGELEDLKKKLEE